MEHFLDLLNIEEMPKRVKVGHTAVDIFIHGGETSSGKNAGLMSYAPYGVFHESKSSINVQDTGSDTELLNTIMHEITHAIHSFMGLNDQSTEEEFTGRGTNGLLCFYLDNPEFTEWFFLALNSVSESMQPESFSEVNSDD